ncbi:hypothetical protein CPB83DRAFT_894587 [Crepidotus variabilis]|uniref:Uncharacterized protein n=1 Tax=Crepidotus variabilis TaxID=179855 RepID=A0A9P6JPZ4_9AGAR|nr:hypothetical protein CPB83DRAFT_894587 [Crepidotus variabilis]
MLSTALRYINLIVLPHPSFNVPPSGFDPVHRCFSYRKREDRDVTYDRLQNSSFAQLDSLAVLGVETTPAKKRISSAHRQTPQTVVPVSGFVSTTKQRIYSPENIASASPRRNTVAFPSFGEEDATNALLEVPRVILTQSQHPESLAPPSPSGHSSMWETTPTKNMGVGGPKVRIEEPKDIAMQKRLWEDIAALYDGSPTRGEHSVSFVPTPRSSLIKYSLQPSNRRFNKKVIRRHSDEDLSSPSCKLAKRSSAPPVLTLSWETRGLFTLDENTLCDPSTSPSRLPPTAYRKASQRGGRQPLSGINANSSYTSRLYEFDLSPIIEDAHVFTDPCFEEVAFQPAKKQRSENNNEYCEGALDSSGSSYGEVLQESASFRLLPSSNIVFITLLKTFDYFNFVDADNTTAWHDSVVDTEFRKRDLQMKEQTQEEDYSCANDFYDGIPQVTLTAATPELKGDTLSTWMSKLVHVPSHSMSQDQSGCHMNALQWDEVNHVNDRQDRTTNYYPIMPTDLISCGGRAFRRTSFVTRENDFEPYRNCPRPFQIQSELMNSTATTTLDDRRLAFGPDLKVNDGTCRSKSIVWTGRASRASDSAIQETPGSAETGSFSRLARSLLRPVSWFGQRSRNTFMRLEDPDTVALSQNRLHSWNLPKLSRVAKDIYPTKTVRTGGIEEVTKLTEEAKARRRHSSFMPVRRSGARSDYTVDDPISPYNLPRAEVSLKSKEQFTENKAKKKRRWTLLGSVKRPQAAL